MNKNYRPGIATGVDYRIPIEKIIKIASDCGFKFLSISARPKHSHFFNPDKYFEIARLAGNLGLTIESAHAPFWEEYDIAASVKSDRETALENILHYLGFASKYEIPQVIIHPHYYFSDSVEDVFARAVDSLNTLLEKKPQNINLAIENLPTAPATIICDMLLKHFGEEKIGFCYDSSHENMSGDPFEILGKHYNRLTITHLSDNKGESDEHLVPGDGTVDWGKLKAYIDKSPLEDILFEVGTGDPLSEPIERFVRRAAEAAYRMFGDF